MSVTEAMIACRVDGVILHVLHLDDGGWCDHRASVEACSVPGPDRAT